jgi:two-component system NtrC family sensor kinase
VFLFLVLALVPLVIIGAFSINITENLTHDLVLRQLENVAADKAAILERWLEERKADVQVIAGTSILKTMDPAVIAPYLDLIQAHYGVYKDITVINAESDIVVSTHRPAPAIDIAGWTWNGAKEACFSPTITYLQSEKESAFHITGPIVDDRMLLGFVYGTVGTNNIIYTILHAALGKTGECYLVDKNGTFLAHKEPRRILVENISQSESFKNIFGNRDTTESYRDYRNIEVLGTSQKVKGTDWYIVVEQDRDEAFQGMDTLKKYLYFTIVVAMASALVLTWVISYHVVGPIRDLSQSAHTLAGAQFETHTVDTNRRDEIGVLCRAFVDMACKIRERQDTLEQKFNMKEAELEVTGNTLKQFKLVAERSEKFAALGRLGSAVAHEIRTPLTSLKLFLESVQAEIEISPEYLEDFTIAMGQIKRIEDAINRLLDFTKPKEPIFSDVDIFKILTDVVSIVRPLANKQECLIEVISQKDLPSIKADKKLLEEALINLFINSLEAISGKGKINVDVVSDFFGSAGSKISCVRIDIKDTGPGISPDSMDLIFDPFFTTKSSGSGLGLPLVLNTIRRHGGEIRVKNCAHSGTVFSLFLPIQYTTV